MRKAIILGHQAATGIESCCGSLCLCVCNCVPVFVCVSRRQSSVRVCVHRCVYLWIFVLPLLDFTIIASHHLVRTFPQKSIGLRTDVPWRKGGGKSWGEFCCGGVSTDCHSKLGLGNLRLSQNFSIPLPFPRSSNPLFLLRNHIPKKIRDKNNHFSYVSLALHLHAT